MPWGGKLKAHHLPLGYPELPCSPEGIPAIVSLPTSLPPAWNSGSFLQEGTKSVLTCVPIPQPWAQSLGFPLSTQESPQSPKRSSQVLFLPGLPLGVRIQDLYNWTTGILTPVPIILETVSMGLPAPPHGPTYCFPTSFSSFGNWHSGAQVF